MDQISGTTTSDAPAQPPQGEPPAGAAPASEPTGFRSRGSARRRARFLRKARELGYRDLGGLVFNLHRFGQRNDALVLAKLTTLVHIDTELRALEGMLGERQSVTILREAGVTACPRCAAIHSSEDNFCPNCGFSISHQADLPIAAAAPTAAPAPMAAPVPTTAPSIRQASMPAQQPPPSDEDGPTEIIHPPLPGS
ncbi:MAG: zinc ribbon domain-containing protein [Solirubrobacteraceae bacterium]